MAKELSATPRNMQLEAFKNREASLVKKIAKIKSGEINCEEKEGDGRQEEALLRNEKFLRDVRKAIAAIKP